MSCERAANSSRSRRRACANRMCMTCRSSRKRRTTESSKSRRMATSHCRILILDFGAQYTQLIARRLRELHVYCEIHPYDVGDDFIRTFAPRVIVLSGGPNSVTEGHAPRAPAAVWSQGVPVLGICYGMQTMAVQLGGSVEGGRVREFGYAEVRARNHSRLLRELQDRTNTENHGLLDVWMSHGDKVTRVPTGFRVIGSSNAC